MWRVPLVTCISRHAVACSRCTRPVAFLLRSRPPAPPMTPWQEGFKRIHHVDCVQEEFFKLYACCGCCQMHRPMFGSAHGMVPAAHRPCRPAPDGAARAAALLTVFDDLLSCCQIAVRFTHW